MAAQLSEVMDLDLLAVIMAIFVILEFIKGAVTLLEWTAEKFGIKFSSKEKREDDHKLLKKTADGLEDLKVALVETNKRIDKINGFADQISNTLNTLQSDSDANKKATVEILYTTITEKCNHYIDDLDGVPSDDVEPLTRLLEVYKGCGGNHGLENRVNYCIKQLPVIPNKTIR